MKAKLLEWLMRYLAAEIYGTISLIIGSAMAYWLCENKIARASIAAGFELAGFYLAIIRQDIKKSMRQGPYSFRRFRIDIRRIVCEFGAAEYLDTILRPFFLYTMPVLIGNYAFGVAAGKLCADAAFYFLAIMARETQIHLEEKKG